MANSHQKQHACLALTALAIVLGAAVPQLAAAQGYEELTVDVNDCLALEKRDERLACFDAQVEAARQRAEPAPAAPAAPQQAAPAPAARPAAPTAAAPPPAVSERRAAEPATPRPAPPADSSRRRTRSKDDAARAEAAADQPGEIVAKVAELRETVPNAFVITLDNGQVWRQSQPMRYPLRAGMEVRLHETKFGYRLTAPVLRGQITVERVR